MPAIRCAQADFRIERYVKYYRERFHNYYLYRSSTRQNRYAAPASFRIRLAKHGHNRFENG